MSMETSDVISSLAMVVALFSFWLSYRSIRQSNLIIAAEKRTEAHAIFVQALLDAQELREVIRNSDEYKNGGHEFTKAEQSISETTSNISKKIEELRKGDVRDSILLEAYKSYAMTLRAHLTNMTPRIREIALREIASNVLLVEASAIFEESLMRIHRLQKLIGDVITVNTGEAKFIDFKSNLSEFEVIISEYIDWLSSKETLDATRLKESVAHAKGFNFKSKDFEKNINNYLKSINAKPRIGDV